MIRVDRSDRVTIRSSFDKLSIGALIDRLAPTDPSRVARRDPKNQVACLDRMAFLTFVIGAVVSSDASSEAR